MGIRPPSQDNSPDSAQVRRAVRADLKARFDARRVRESDRIDQFLKASMEARAAGDWAAAVNSLRMAISRKPDDVILAQQLEAMQAEADIALAPKFLEQAQYEEKNGSPDRAARSYERAAQGKKSPELFNKAARCLLSVRPKSEDDLRKTAEMARQAVALDKQKATYRITLARAYDAAGMRTSALGELNRALELEPNNNEAKELLKQFK
jgi:tetratricopeptide (TPR) repeat protein